MASLFLSLLKKLFSGLFLKQSKRPQYQLLIIIHFQISIDKLSLMFYCQC